MAVARRLTSLGRAARAEAGVKVRQPLARALVFLAGAARRCRRTASSKTSSTSTTWSTVRELAEVLTFELVPNFRVVGPRLGEAVKELRPALAALDSVAAAAPSSPVSALAVTLSTGDVRAERRRRRAARQGSSGLRRLARRRRVVALDLTLNDELRRRGFLRDVVRQVQDLRKNSGLDVADRIVLHVTGLDDLADGFAPWRAKYSPSRSSRRRERVRVRCWSSTTSETRVRWVKKA